MGQSQFDENAAFVKQLALGNGSLGSVFSVEVDANRPRRFDAVVVANGDTIDHDVQLLWSNADQALLAQVTIPAAAGAGTGVSVNLFESLPPALQGGFALDTNVLLGVQIVSIDVSALKFVYVTAVGGYLG